MDTLGLVALKRFAHSVGVIEAGERFNASHFYGRELIESGFARRSDANVVRSGLWAGCTVAIVASGPSLEEQDLEALRAWRDASPARRKVLVLNLTFRRALWADALYAADDLWWDEYHAEVERDFAGERWSQSEHARRRYGTRFIQCERREGLSRIRGVINSGGHSGYQALGLAYELAAPRVILLAYDMQSTGGKLHHHPPYPHERGFMRNGGNFDKWCGEMGALARNLESEGVSVVNASRTTALTCFARTPLHMALSAAERAEDASGGRSLPERAYCLLQPTQHYQRDTFVSGLKRIGCQVSCDADLIHPDERTLLVIWNRYGEAHRLASQVEAAGGSVIVAENGYLAPGGGVPKFDAENLLPIERYFALALSGHNGSGFAPMGSAERFERLRVEVKPWRESGEHILICPNRSFGRPDMVMPENWSQDVARELQRRTARPVRIRAHPKNKAPAVSLQDDLRGAWAVVIWSSSAGIHALIEGVPVFQCGPYFVATAATSMNLKMIEDPAMDDGRRVHALRAVAGAQFSLAEIASGEAYMSLLGGQA
jgi:hypothetical protein